MKVFDIGKNVPSSLFVGHVTLDTIHKLCQKEKDESTALLGMHIYVDDDADSRQRKAICMSALSGRPVIYEGEGGRWMEVTMPNGDTRFPRYYPVCEAMEMDPGELL